MKNGITIRPAGLSDSQLVAQLQLLLWPDHTPDEMKLEMDNVLASPYGVVFIAFIDESPLGFAECRLRHDYVEGTHTNPVGYLEGIYVKPEYRRQGVARFLCKYCENWAKNKGCSEFASDCELINQASIAFHRSTGFQEANRIVCFSKKLTKGINRKTKTRNSGFLH